MKLFELRGFIMLVIIYYGSEVFCYYKNNISNSIVKIKYNVINCGF